MSQRPESVSTETVNASRRRFTRAGAASGAVLGTLVSKPVLATTLTKPPYQCTISGQLSGNLSHPTEAVDCHTLGRSPGYWKTHLSWPGGLKAGGLPNSSCTFASGQTGTYFNGLAINGKTLADAFRSKTISGACEVVDARMAAYSTATKKATLLQVLNAPGGLNDTQLEALGRSTVATILNSLAYPAWYPLTPEKAIEMFNAVYMGGTYKVNATTSWNADQVLAYFQSCYG